MTGERIGAARARDLGIVNRVPDDLDETARNFAETIASKPPLPIRAIEESANVATQTRTRGTTVRPSAVRTVARR